MAAAGLPTLELNGYGALFGARVVLADVSCSLPADGLDVLMGPVKTGKSTLMRSLAGLNDANRSFRCWGTALLDGQPVGAGTRPLLVQQKAAVLGMSVRDALVAGLRERESRVAARWDECAREALARFDSPIVADQLGETMLALPAHLQRMVLILSQALLAPSCLFVDEPTFGLADAEAEVLLAWLVRLGQTQKMLVTLHHQGQARRIADRILLLGGGRVLAHQRTEDFFLRPANQHVEHYVRTGSLPLPAPDSSPAELEDPSLAPPPLPVAARSALGAVRQTTAAGTTPTGGATAPSSGAADAPARSDGPAPSSPRRQAAAPGTPPARSFALPQPEHSAVDEASTVGQVILSEYRGPRGFHWVVPGKLAGCPEPGVTTAVPYDLDLLRAVGITYLITLTERDLDQELLAEAGLKNVHLPIFDREAPSINQAYMLLVRMQTLMKRGEVLAVHCKAGIGRTGTILGAWLIRDGGLSASTAIERLRKINPAFVQTPAQERFLQELEQDLLMRMA